MPTETAFAPPRLSARGLTVSRSGRRILQGVDLSLAPGEAVWLGGPSGSGKSTLLLALARLLPLDDGDLALEGTAATQLTAPEWRAQVLLAPHPPLALGDTVEADLLSPYRLRRRRRQPTPDQTSLKKELAALGLEGVELEQPPRRLSQGQLGRLALARALLINPSVLLLDEPTANLDPEAAALVEGRVASYCSAGGAAVIASHGAPWKIPSGTVSLVATDVSGNLP